MKYSYPFLFVISLTWGTGCSEQGTNNVQYAGNMADTSYAGQITPTKTKFRINALGEEIAIDKYSGKFVWVDLAAPWCSACVPQTKAIKRLEKSFSEEVVFITIMTSRTAGKSTSPANRQTAIRWSKELGLDPEKVLAAPELWGRKVPAHFFYSPTGQTLFHHVGGLSDSQISDTLHKYIYDWEQWDKHGTLASWMQD
jgi:thiol-disulfide isomerase/thioredoxin